MHMKEEDLNYARGWHLKNVVWTLLILNIVKKYSGDFEMKGKSNMCVALLMCMSVFVPRKSFKWIFLNIFLQFRVKRIWWIKENGLYINE